LSSGWDGSVGGQVSTSKASAFGVIPSDAAVKVKVGTNDHSWEIRPGEVNDDCWNEASSNELLSVDAVTLLRLLKLPKLLELLSGLAG
jgi:hypothetical protein